MTPRATPARPRRSTRREAGIALVLVAVAFMLLIAFAALAVDGSHIYEIRTQCQATADSAALAAASLLPDLVAARAAAIAYGAKNMDSSIHGVVIDDNDVEFGSWDFVTHTFTVSNNSLQTNAVRVTTRRSTANNNALQLTLGKALGFSSTDVTNKAVAAFSSQEPWDIALTQDVTNSFTAEISYAKTADQNLLDCMSSQAPVGTKFGIVTFTGWGKVHSPLAQVATSYSTLKTAISGIKVCGSTGAPVCSGTDIAAGLEKAVGMLDASSSPSAQKRAIVLVSDGQPQSNSSGSHPTSSDAQLKTMATNWANTAWNKGYSVFVVYFDGDQIPAANAFMESLIRGEGIYLSTPDPTELPDLLSAICGSLVNLQLVE